MYEGELFSLKCLFYCDWQNKNLKNVQLILKKKHNKTHHKRVDKEEWMKKPFQILIFTLYTHMLQNQEF